MNRRDFIKSSAILAAGSTISGRAETPAPIPSLNESAAEGALIDSAPMLQNYAETSMGIAFGVSDMANGFVTYGEKPDLSDGKTVKCGGYRVTDMNDKVMLVRLTGLKPATKYYYRIGADRISYKSGYDMKIIGTETDSRIYSFTTAGVGAKDHFCVINDTHGNKETFETVLSTLQKLHPSCVIWNGDATSCEEEIEDQKRIFLSPTEKFPDYASETPYLFTCGNHDSRGMANRHMERVWMFRQPEERKSRDWDLGRNYAVRMGNIAMIGLDTAEDKMDSNPKFAGLFTSAAYREAQVAWLEDALKQPEIKSAPFLVAFCHIPLFCDDPKANPGDIFPDDSDPAYEDDYASWQRTCAKLWTPLLEKAGCQLIIAAHEHRIRYDAPTADRKWAQLVGGGSRVTDSDTSFPSVIQGFVENKELKIALHNACTGKVVNTYTFKARKGKKIR